MDLKTLNRIKTEAFQDSQVMDHLFYLSDVYGPRLTNSPEHRAAAEWVVKRLESYGLQDVRLEKWGPFGQSWKLNHFSAHLLEPQYAPLIGFPLAWTPGTNGVVLGEPVLAPIRSEADFAKYRGKLKGKIVLTMDPKVCGYDYAAASKMLDPRRTGRAGHCGRPGAYGTHGTGCRYRSHASY